MQQKTNYVALIIDQSDSMRPLRYDVEKRVNDLLAQIKARKDQDNRVGVYCFSETVLGPMEKYPSTFMGQNTALLDAIGQAVEDLSTQKPARKIFPWEQEDSAFLVIVLTDGEENSSKFYAGPETFGNWRAPRKSIVDLLKKKQAEGNWTFAFQLPPGKADYFSRTFGIPRENCTEWEGTKKGFEETSVRTEQSFAAYSSVRAAGGTKSTSFYVAPDLSKVKAKDLKQLDDMTSRFAQFRVDKESDIKAFVEKRTKKPYIPGTAFFQLTKPEKVQATKQIALIGHGEKTVLGGQQARDLIGLKPFVDARVTPGNHGNYDIFIQSNSANRKLVRGTKVLVIK